VAEDVTLKIAGRKWEHWADRKIVLSLDSYATLEFVAPFEATRKEFRETFRPFSYKPIEVSVANQTAFRGFMMGIHPEVSAEVRQVKITGYAKPAIFSDVTVPASALPLEFNKLTLNQIANAIAELFDIRVYFPENDRTVFEKQAIKSDQKIHAFLADLAQHRSMLLSNTLDGDLLIWRAVTTGKPVARLKDHEQPVTSVEPSFDTQEYFSEITGFAPAKRGREGSAHTEKNTWLPDVNRPLSFVLDNIEKGDAPEATLAKLGRMFANAAGYTVGVATWRDPAGNLWAPNTTITLDAPDAMIYRETEFLIRTVTLEQDENSETATLGLVLPGSFSGEIPERLPWDE